MKEVGNMDIGERLGLRRRWVAANSKYWLMPELQAWSVGFGEMRGLVDGANVPMVLQVLQQLRGRDVGVGDRFGEKRGVVGRVETECG